MHKCNLKTYFINSCVQLVDLRRVALSSEYGKGKMVTSMNNVVAYLKEGKLLEDEQKGHQHKSNACMDSIMYGKNYSEGP